MIKPTNSLNLLDNPSLHWQIRSNLFSKFEFIFNIYVS
jgi:hypothetical protein